MGRKPKEKLTQEEMEDLVMCKWLNHEPMSLEEASIALWMHEGRKRARPYTKMQILKIEQQALKKLRDGLAKFGIKNLDDVFDPGYRNLSSSSSFPTPDM